MTNESSKTIRTGVSNDRSNRLSAEQVAAFRRDGILAPIPVLSADETASYRAAFDELYQYLGQPTRISCTHLSFRWAYDLVTHPALLDAVASILGPELVVESANILIKPPRSAAFAPWHQDVRFAACTDPSLSFTAWLALSPSTSERGCMRVIPCSHRDQVALPHNVSDASDANFLYRKPQIAIAVDETQARDIVLQPGEVSFHHSCVIHGSGANRSDEERIGFGVHYVTPSMSSCKIPVLQPRGQAPLHHLEVLRDPPPSDFQLSLKRRDEIFQRYGLN